MPPWHLFQDDFKSVVQYFPAIWRHILKRSRHTVCPDPAYYAQAQCVKNAPEYWNKLGGTLQHTFRGLELLDATFCVVCRHVPWSLASTTLAKRLPSHYLFNPLVFLFINYICQHSFIRSPKCIHTSNHIKSNISNVPFSHCNACVQCTDSFSLYLPLRTKDTELLCACARSVLTGKWQYAIRWPQIICKCVRHCTIILATDQGASVSGFQREWEMALYLVYCI